MSKAIAEYEADVEKAYRALEEARRQSVPAEEMMIYHRRLEDGREALDKARRAQTEPEG